MNDELHDLPGSWLWVRVDDAGIVQLGRQRAPQHHSGTHMRPYLRVANVFEDRIDTSDVLEMNFTPAEAERYLLAYGDILLNEGQSKELVGRPAMFRDEVPGACFQNTLVRFRVYEGVVPDFALGAFRHYLHAGYFRAVCKWTTNIAHLGAQRFAAMPFPLAPAAEQRRIADKLDALLTRVTACRKRLDRVPDILERFRQSVLAAATSGELTREWREDAETGDTWTRSTMGTTGTVTGGITKNSSRANTTMKCAYLRVANVYANRLELEDVREIATNKDEYSRTRLVPGDVLIVEGNGSIEQIGRAAIWRGELAECSHQNHLIKWRSAGEVLPEYALYWLLSPHGRAELVQVAKSSAGLYTLSLSKISAIPISVPPLAEQKEIVRRADELLAFADRLEAHLDRAESRVRTLVPATLAKAFRGELVPQDPDDEPASELLARIRAARAAEENTKPKRGGKRKTRTKKAPEVAMLTRSDVKTGHLSAILQERGALSAEALWNASQLDIDEFYEQLKEEEAQGLLRERRGKGRDDARLLEAAA